MSIAPLVSLPPVAPFLRLTTPRAAGFGGAVAWVLLCVRWFDAGAPWRPSWLAALSPGVLFVVWGALTALWLRARGRALWGRLQGNTVPGLLLIVALAALFRLPLAWHGAVGYTTPDAALSGTVALHVRAGTAHDVFVPNVPYSGSLKSHLAAALAGVVDLPRAFTLASVGFYALFVAAVYRLALLTEADPRVATAAGLYAAFSPAFVTHYSLSNDGNYVEVLAFGTWALVLAARWLGERDERRALSLGLGLLLGLGFWCHVLAVLYAAAAGAVLLLADRRGVVRALPALAAGFMLGDAPGLLWNAGHSWDSFRSLVPGLHPGAAAAGGPGLAGRALAMVTDHWPILLGYDRAERPAVDLALRLVAFLAVAASCLAVGRAVRDAHRRPFDALWLLLALVAVNVVVAVTALRYVPENPRYLLFLMTPLPILLARSLARGAWRWLLPLFVACGALASLGQAAGEVQEDAQWRGFVRALEGERVRFCYTDFYVAARINFLSEERVICSSKLGPDRTEYFFEFRERVDRAPEAAYVAATYAQADKLERRLGRLGVTWRRVDLLKPVLLDFSRKVDPQELFPEQSFGLR